MSNSVVPAAAVAHAKQLVRNKNLTKQAGNQQHAPDEQNAVDHSTANDHHQFDAANVVQVDQPDHVDAAHLSMAMPMGDVAMGDSVFVDALAGAAVSEAALTTSYAAGSAQDDGGSASDDGASGPGGTVLLVGAVGLAGLGVAVAASGGGNGGDNDGGNGGGNENQAPTFTSDAAASVDENADLTTVLYDADATDADGDTLTYAISGDNADLFDIDAASGEVTQKDFINVDAATDYHFTVTASDGTDDTALDVTLTINPVAGTEVSLDDPGSAGRDAVIIDASDGAYVFTDDASVDTNVIIQGFGDDDVINVVGAASDDYGFGTATDPLDPKDVQITYQDDASGALNVIVIDDVLPDSAGPFFTEAGAETQVGYNFINFA